MNIYRTQEERIHSDNLNQSLAEENFPSFSECRQKKYILTNLYRGQHLPSCNLSGLTLPANSSLNRSNKSNFGRYLSHQSGFSVTFSFVEVTVADIR